MTIHSSAFQDWSQIRRSAERFADLPRGEKVTPEIELIWNRASKLTTPQLAQLSKISGIKMAPPLGHLYCNREDYIYTLSEADDISKVTNFLDAHGV